MISLIDINLKSVPSNPNACPATLLLQLPEHQSCCLVQLLPVLNVSQDAVANHGRPAIDELSGLGEWANACTFMKFSASTYDMIFCSALLISSTAMPNNCAFRCPNCDTGDFRSLLHEVDATNTLAADMASMACHQGQTK